MLSKSCMPIGYFIIVSISCSIIICKHTIFKAENQDAWCENWKDGLERFLVASIFYETSSHVVLGKHQGIFEKVFDELKKTLWRVFCSPWWTDRYALAYWERRLGEFLSSLWRMKKSVKAYEANSKTCKTSLHKCHGGITCWFIIPSCEAWVHSPRFTGFTSNQSTKIRAICEACEPSVKVWRFT